VPRHFISNGNVKRKKEFVNRKHMYINSSILAQFLFHDLTEFDLLALDFQKDCFEAALIFF
jgi:hypothetical protein